MKNAINKLKGQIQVSQTQLIKVRQRNEQLETELEEYKALQLEKDMLNNKLSEHKLELEDHKDEIETLKNESKAKDRVHKMLVEQKKVLSKKCAIEKHKYKEDTLQNMMNQKKKMTSECK